MVRPSRVTSSVAPPPVSFQIQSVLLEHLSLLASTHQQVVAHRMALGAVSEQLGKPKKAIAAYQDILDQPSLSAAMWEDDAISVRGGLESKRRIGELLGNVGYAPYESFNKLAQTERTFLEPNLDASVNPSAHKQLAQRYPWAKITPSLWLDVATILRKQNHLSASINAANQGLDAATDMKKIHVSTNQQYD